MNELILYTPDLNNELPIPFADGGIKAGFPSPAQDYAMGSLDLAKELVTNKAATFYARVVGDSMSPIINEGDIVVVDRSIEPFQNCTAVCYVDNEFNIKHVDFSQKDKNIIRLLSDNPKYDPIIVKEDDEFILWGVVTYCIHKLI